MAKERVGLAKEVETRQQTISDEVRKEHVAVEGDAVDSEPRRDG